ncbi:hypothetical protein HanPI659440_Chr10g0397931 [Helianthus annuus]|nr:hypothetical protein HanPI659440_Chr10g0397931 [Helianthus annuus]
MSYNLTTEYLQLVDELVDDYNIPTHIIYSLLAYVKPLYRSDLENNYSTPMVWIGMCIVFASLVCILAMVADLLHGIRSRKLWFPCKYFRMNAAFLSIMFVAMKLPVDLSGVIPGDMDEAGKLGSMAFMCAMMANILPSLATMGSNELLSNITALCVLVFTLVLNVCIQIQSGVVSYNEDSVMQMISPKYDVQSLGISKHRNTLLATIYMTLLVVLLIIHVCSSLAILKSKKIIELKYRQGHNIASKDIQQSSEEVLTVEKLQKHVRNHWIMAESGSPQFITACFHTTSASGVFEVESYWTQKLYDWKHASIRLPLRSDKLKGVTQILKRLTLSFCIELQEGVVVVCKIIALIPFSLMLCVLYCLKSVKVVFCSAGQKTDNLEPSKDLRPYVLQLEDEIELAERTMEGLTKSVNQFIQKGEENQPNNLIKLILEKPTCGFQGVKMFDNMNHQVPSSLLKVEYQDCWSIPVVTLTTIATSLPKIEKKEVDSLLKSVREGFVYVTHVEENLNTTDDYATLQEAARTLWQEVDVHHKWLGYKLQDPALQENRAGQIVEWFRDTAKRIIHTKDDTEGGNENSIHGGTCKDECISRSICANSMYGITTTILRTYQTNIDDKVSQKKLFDNLSSMITDVMAACLTNLPQVITMKCHTGVIEKREGNVKHAAQLLGETTQIIKTLQDHGIPRMNSSDLPFMGKWRAYLLEP